MIYETISAPETWDDVLRHMADRLAASAGLFFKPLPGGPELLAQMNIIPSLLAEYVAYYHQNDVLVRSSIGRERELAGRALRIHHLMDVRSFRNSEFCNDFLRRHAIADVLSSVIADPTMASGPPPILGFYRPPDAPLFSDADVRRMQLWLPHVQRALRLRASTACQAQDVPALAGSLLEQLQAGILIIDGRHHVIYANPPAGATIDRRDGLCLSAGKLTSPLAATARAIDAALSAALSAAPVGRDLRAPRQSGGAEWLVSICPLSPPPAGAIRRSGLGACRRSTCSGARAAASARGTVRNNAGRMPGRRGAASRIIRGGHRRGAPSVARHSPNPGASHFRPARRPAAIGTRQPVA